MNIAILTSRYPSENSPYNHMFVHIRSLEIKRQGHLVTVYVPSTTKYTYDHEGVNVKTLPSVSINKELEKYDVVYLHLLNIYPYQKSDGWIIYKYIMQNNIPFAMYVHGSEVQKYGARMFDFNYRVSDFLKWYKKDVLVIPKIKKFIKSTLNRNNMTLIFPSIWMKNNMSYNLNIPIRNFKVIPNGIDNSLFKFNDLYPNRYKLLTLRPLSSNKYAVDIAIEVMKYLPKEYTLDIYGKGRYESLFLKKIKKLNLESQVTIHNNFIERCELNNFFSQYGVFLAPTRMDAQGVSMCEAMASGLLTASSNNTAIPEFVEDMKSGVLGLNAQEIATKIVNISRDYTEYNSIVKRAKYSMEKIDVKNTVAEELQTLLAIKETIC